MAEYRVQIRPRLGAAMSLASDGIFTRFGAVIERRGGERSTQTELAVSAGIMPVGDTLASEPDAKRATTRHGVSEPRPIDLPTAGAAVRRQAGARRGHLQLVNKAEAEADNLAPLRAEDDAGGGDAGSGATAHTSSIASILRTAGATLDRWSNLAIPSEPSRGALASATQAQPEAAAPVPGASGTPRSPLADLADVVQASARAKQATSKSQPNSGTAVHQGAAQVSRSHPIGTQSTAAHPSSGTSDAASPLENGPHLAPGAQPRDSADVQRHLAEVLMPPLPSAVLAAVPSTATPADTQAATDEETTFEFEMRVRAALERIMAEDMLRHGLTQTELP
ncbi:MAG: hypothetical protein AAGK00_00940 [Pseudomonadota bacterium]